MLKRIRPSLTYANVVSTLCLFVVLGGSSYAVVRGSIGSREIKNNSVRSADLRNNDVRGKDLRRNSLGGREINEGRLASVPAATRATTADSAANASTLGGLGPDAFKLRCPAGTGLNAGHCVEEAARAALDYDLARQECERAGRRIPTYEELTSFLGRRVDLDVAPGGELTGNVFESRTTAGQLDVVVLTSEAGAAAFVPARVGGFARAYRCAVPPGN